MHSSINATCTLMSVRAVPCAPACIIDRLSPSPRLHHPPIHDTMWLQHQRNVQFKSSACKGPMKCVMTRWCSCFAAVYYCRINLQRCRIDLQSIDLQSAKYRWINKRQKHQASPALSLASSNIAVRPRFLRTLPLGIGRGPASSNVAAISSSLLIVGIPPNPVM